MSTKKVYPRSLRGTLDVLEKLALGDDDTVFRGHSDSEWRICSTLSRYSVTPHESWDSRIDEMLSHFMTNLRSIGEMPADLNSDRRARLEYGRHYDVPSPLIDFSLSLRRSLFRLQRVPAGQNQTRQESRCLCPGHQGARSGVGATVRQRG